MHRNFDYLNRFGNISEEAFLEITKITEFKRVKSGTQLVKLGEVPTKIYFLVSGIVRCYITTEAGREFNKSFYLSTSFVGSLTSLITNKPSLFVFEALTDCKIYEVDFNRLKTLCYNNQGLNSLYSRVLEVVYIQYERRLLELMSLDATDRYLALKEQIPNVDNIIPQYHIASYLGITAVQLSRIRKKIDGN